jgi:YegS/Rv2252/BmrU family lipid kinase
MKKQMFVIINPVSGTKSKTGLPEKLSSRLDAEKYDLHFLHTQYQGHATELAQQAVEQKADYVIAAGGDGTINETARALTHTGVVFGILPYGSGNGLARDLGISAAVNKAIEVIAADNIVDIDYGKVNGIPFFCTCGMGFDAVIGEMATKQQSRGFLMYVKNVLSALWRYDCQNYKIWVSGEKIFDGRAFILTCANSNQYGNHAYIAPLADLRDGLMNIEILKPLHLIQMPWAALRSFMRSIHRHKRMQEILTTRATIERSGGGFIHIDGNAQEATRKVDVEIIRHGLRVLSPLTPKNN